MADAVNITRRRALAMFPAIGAVAVSPSVLMAAHEGTAEYRLETAINAVIAAMKEIHGEGVVVTRNGNTLFAVMEPIKPRIVEFSGPGAYVVEMTRTLSPIYVVERAPQHDCPSMGRCFKMTPRDVKRLTTSYVYEEDLRHMLIRKL